MSLENSDDGETDDFVGFIKEGGYTAEQMREAYYRLVGVSDEIETVPEVEAILNKMREMTGKSFPLKNFPISRFATLIGTKKKFESAVPLYHKYIDALKISDVEKGILRSIIDNERDGEVTFLVDGKTVGYFGGSVKNLSKEIATIAMVEAIEKVIEKIPKGKKYEITFSE